LLKEMVLMNSAMLAAADSIVGIFEGALVGIFEGNNVGALVGASEGAMVGARKREKESEI